MTVEAQALHALGEADAARARLEAAVAHGEGLPETVRPRGLLGRARKLLAEWGKGTATEQRAVPPPGWRRLAPMQEHARPRPTYLWRTGETATVDPKAAGIAHVREIAEKDYDTSVLGAPLPVPVHFCGADSKPCEALAPRFTAVAEKFTDKVAFLEILRQGNAELATRLGVTSSPTVVFSKGGKESGTRLGGDEILRTAVKAGVEALLA
jgi:thioredoxin reductase (NADPH)/thioredoxin 1